MMFRVSYYNTKIDWRSESQQIYDNVLGLHDTIEEAFEALSGLPSTEQYKYIILSDSNQEITPRDFTKNQLLRDKQYWIDCYKQSWTKESKIIQIKDNSMAASNAARNVFLVIGIEHAESKVDQTGNDVTPDSTIVLPLTAIIARDENHAHTVATVAVANAKKDVNLKNLEIKVKGF